MQRWRGADQQPVTTRHAVVTALAAVTDEILELAACSGVRPQVIACWHHDETAGVTADLLSRLASTADLVVACVGPAPVQDGVDHVELDLDEPLADEWSVTALTPDGGISFVAHTIAMAGTTAATASAPGGPSPAYRWDLTDDSYEVVATTRRLLREIGARTPPGTLARLHATTTSLAAVASTTSPGPMDTERLALPVVAALMDERRRAQCYPVVAGGAGDDLGALARWLSDAGPRSPSLGMIVVRCAAPGAAASLRAHAESTGRDGDVVVDVPPDAAMLVLPDLTGPALAARTEAVRSAVARALGADATAIGVDVPAVEARRDLVGTLGRALATLRAGRSVTVRTA